MITGDVNERDKQGEDEEDEEKGDNEGKDERR